MLASFTQDHVAGRLTHATSLTQLGGEAQGLMGEYFNFPRTGIARVPDYLTLEEASCLPVSIFPNTIPTLLRTRLACL